MNCTHIEQIILIGFRYFSGLQFTQRKHLTEVLDSSYVIFSIPVVHI